MAIRKILLITNIRVGGTYLMKYLAKSINGIGVFEPTDLPLVKSRAVIKINPLMHTLDDIVEYTEHFDRVFIIDRKDKTKQIESAAHMYTTPNSQKKWKWTDKLRELPSYKMSIDRVLENSIALNILAERLNKEIFYYEDIYYGNQNLDDIEFTPDLNKKLRVESKNKTLT